MQKTSRRFRNGVGYHIMVLPMLILYLTFIIYPFLSTIFYSLQIIPALNCLTIVLLE